MALEEFLNKSFPFSEPARLQPLGSMLPQPMQMSSAATSEQLALMLQLMKEGVVTAPAWFMDPGENRAVIMVPIDITMLNPAMNKQLEDLMVLNSRRAGPGSKIV